MSNTPESYADLLKSRGDVAISALRNVYQQIGTILAAVDEMDITLDVAPAPTEPQQAIAAALRARYPEFADKSDVEILKHFGVEVG